MYKSLIDRETTLELKKAKNNCKIFFKAYNKNTLSMKIELLLKQNI